MLSKIILDDRRGWSVKAEDILMIVPRFHIGGGERVTLHIINELLAKGKKVSVVVIIGGGTSQRLLENMVRPLTMTVTPRPGEVQSFWRIAGVVAAKFPQLLQLAGRSDLIMAIGEFGGSLYLGTLLSVLSRKPMVAWAFGEVFKMSTLRPDLRIRGLIHRVLLRWCYPQARRILALSSSTALDLQRNMPAIGSKIEIIYPPVITNDLYLNALKPIPILYEDWFRYPVILAFGRHELRKGFHILIRAHAYLRHRFDHRLVIVGPEGSATEQLHKVVHELGVEDTVIFTGFLENPYPLLRHCTIFAFPSLSEGFGLALVEAMALGKPVVVSDGAGGALDVIGYGQYGIVVRADDPLAWGDALEELLSSPEQQNYWGIRALGRAREFTIDAFIHRLISVIETSLQ